MLTSAQKWVIMLIVIFFGLLLFALAAVLLKRRHDRKADQPREGFNAGITTRSTPMTDMGKSRGGHGDGPADSTFMSNASNSQVMMTTAGGLEAGSGRNSPARTRDAFMPYGYGYARSESRLASHGDGGAQNFSMPGRGGTPVRELEKEVGMGGGSAEAPEKRQRRVLVRERSARGSQSPEMEIEKAYR